MPPALVQTNAWSSRWLISENPATCPSSFIAVAALSKPPASVPKSVTVYDCAPASGTRIKAIAAHRPKLTLPIVQSSVKPIRTTVTMLRVIWTLVKMKVLAQREAYSFGRQVTLSGDFTQNPGHRVDECNRDFSPATVTGVSPRPLGGRVSRLSRCSSAKSCDPPHAYLARMLSGGNHCTGGGSSVHWGRRPVAQGNPILEFHGGYA